jgi:hypothetical protein
MENRFRVALGCEAVPQAQELGPEFVKIVDFPVKDYALGPVFVEYRLVSGRQINDAEPPMAQADMVIAVRPPFIRSPVKKRVRCLLERKAFYVVRSYAEYSAHGKAQVLIVNLLKICCVRTQ